MQCCLQHYCDAVMYGHIFRYIMDRNGFSTVMQFDAQYLEILEQCNVDSPSKSIQVWLGIQQN